MSEPRTEQERADFYQSHKESPDVWGPLKRPRGRPSQGPKAAITVRFTPDELERIDRAAVALGSTYSDVIRRALHAYTGESERKVRQAREVRDSSEAPARRLRRAAGP